VLHYIPISGNIEYEPEEGEITKDVSMDDDELKKEFEME
jgi:hypothetical protein